MRSHESQVVVKFTVLTYLRVAAELGLRDDFKRGSSAALTE